MSNITAEKLLTIGEIKFNELYYMLDSRLRRAGLELALEEICSNSNVEYQKTDFGTYKFTQRRTNENKSIGRKNIGKTNKKRQN